jgi:hypothetical protein
VAQFLTPNYYETYSSIPQRKTPKDSVLRQLHPLRIITANSHEEVLLHQVFMQTRVYICRTRNIDLFNHDVTITTFITFINLLPLHSFMAVCHSCSERGGWFVMPRFSLAIYLMFIVDLSPSHKYSGALPSVTHYNLMYCFFRPQSPLRALQRWEITPLTMKWR